MKKQNQKNKYGFSLVEALMSMVLIGIIILMMAPMLLGKSKRTNEKICVQGGSVIYTTTNTFNIIPGTERIWITAIGQGGSGARGDNTWGGHAGRSSDVWRYNDGKGHNIKATRAEKVEIKFSGGTPTSFVLSRNNGTTIETLNNVVRGAKPATPTYSTSSAAVTHGGVAEYSEFPEGIFGSGGHGGYSNGTYRIEPFGGIGGAVLIEWPTNCTNN